MYTGPWYMLTMFDELISLGPAYVCCTFVDVDCSWTCWARLVLWCWILLVAVQTYYAWYQTNWTSGWTSSVATSSKSYNGWHLDLQLAPGGASFAVLRRLAMWSIDCQVVWSCYCFSIWDFIASNLCEFWFGTSLLTCSGARLNDENHQNILRAQSEKPSSNTQHGRQRAPHLPMNLRR